MNRDLLAVYAILDPDRCTGRDLAALARQAVAGGATLLQLRAERRSTYEQVQLALRLRRVARELGVPLLINDRVDVALAAEADGVHVGHPGVEDMPPGIARRLLGPAAIVGASVATPEEARATAALGVDYVSVGPIFGTGSKADAGAAVGPSRLVAVRRAVDLPLCAIGGITGENAAQAIAAGADGVAVIAAIAAAADPSAAARGIVRAVADALAARSR